VRRQVIIHWGISSFFGFGVYGLNLALNWWLDPQIEPICSTPIRRDQIRLDPLRQLALEPFLANSQRFQDSLKAAAGTASRPPCLCWPASTTPSAWCWPRTTCN
jgi:hypothetical protein